MNRRLILKLFAATPVVGVPPIAAALPDYQKEHLEFIGDVERLTLYADDTIVLRTDQPLPFGMAEHLRMDIKEVFPNHRVIVLDNGLELGVLGRG